LKANYMYMMEDIAQKVDTLNKIVKAIITKSGSIGEMISRNDYILHCHIALKELIGCWKEAFHARFLVDLKDEDNAPLDALTEFLKEIFNNYKEFCAKEWSFSEITGNLQCNALAFGKFCIKLCTPNTEIN